MKDIELLQYVHEISEMGVVGLKDILDRIQDKELKACIQAQIHEYRNISARSAELLDAKGEAPKDPALMARISSKVMSSAQTLTDSSASKIAEMVINVNNMGINKGLKHLHDYKGDDQQVRALTEKLIATEQANVEQMKPFL